MPEAGAEEVWHDLERRLEARRQPGRPTVVGVTGGDAAGKTWITNAFAAYLESRRRSVQVVHVDDFHNPRAYRYAGESEPDNYYGRSFALDRLVGEVLEPIRRDGRLHAELLLLDLASDRFDLRRRYDVTPETVVLLDGVFLLRPELRDYLDLAVHVDVPLAVALERARRRDVPVLGHGVMAKYAAKYVPAQRRHFEEVDPRRAADVVIDNTDEWPRIVSGDSPTRLGAVVFDLWDTLVPLAPELRERAFRAMAAAVGAPLEPLRARWRATRSERECGTLDPALLRVCRELGLGVPETAVADALAARTAVHREAFSSSSPGALDTLRRLRTAGLKIGLVSNCASDVPALFAQTPIAPLVDVALFSCSEGVMKPDPAIYHRVADRLGVEEARCLYVGDGTDDELAGAAAVGMTPVLLHAAGTPPTWDGLRVSMLAEIVELVEALPARAAAE
jgi:HAD superfamily hydrolase (TIGR01549 family)